MIMQGESMAQGILNGLIATKKILDPLLNANIISFDSLAAHILDSKNIATLCDGLLNTKEHLATIQMYVIIESYFRNILTNMASSRAGGWLILPAQILNLFSTRFHIFASLAIS